MNEDDLPPIADRDDDDAGLAGALGRTFSGFVVVAALFVVLGIFAYVLTHLSRLFGQ
jgi:hypothetical protein